VGQKLKSEPIIAHAHNHYKSLFFTLTVPHSGNKASLEIGKSRHPGHRFQGSDVRFNLFAVFIVQTQEFDAETHAFLDIADTGNRDDTVSIAWQLEAHDHSSSCANWLVSRYEQTTGANVGHVFSDARRTAAAVGKLKFNLRVDGGTLKTSSFQLSRTSHLTPSA